MKTQLEELIADLEGLADNLPDHRDGNLVYRAAHVLLSQELQLDYWQYVDDGFGNTFMRCKPGCDMVVTRPGEVTCSCEPPSSRWENDYAD